MSHTAIQLPLPMDLGICERYGGTNLPSERGSMKSTGKPTIVMDLRCLQDPDYALRGVGRHALALLRHAPTHLRLVGLTDPGLPTLLPEAQDRVEVVSTNAYAAGFAGTQLSVPAGFVMMSPMTHDPLFVARLLSNPTLLRAAVVYDFIPRRYPERYLSGPAERLRYATALRWLARCDVFLPISRSTAHDLHELLGILDGAITVTGVGLDPAFEGAARDLKPRHLLVVGGGDPRKNPEVVIRAHASSRVMQKVAGIPLVVAGNYSEAHAQAFRSIAVKAGGRAELVEVPGHVPDAALVQLHGRALAVITASHDEGFSYPVIEGMAAGLPCLVSDIPAHAELVTDPGWRFPADDDAALRPKLEQVVLDAEWRSAALARQADVWPRFRAKAVAGRFWDAVLQRFEARAPTVLRGRRPRVALFSPVPPDLSGVADYTAATCAELGLLVDLHVFTETAHPTPLRNIATVRPLGALPHVSPGFDGVISVVGNSHFHLRIFELLLRYGGACIAHDARMLGFYAVLCGRERALTLASQELGRLVTEDDLNRWLADERTLEALFLGEIARSASPMIVHSKVTARMVQERHGIAPAYIPFSVYRPWNTSALTPPARAAARSRLGLPMGEVVVATFGIIHSSKAPEECVWALEVLRSWGVPASLHFVGSADSFPEEAAALRRLVARLGLAAHVRFVGSDFVPEQTYQDYLAGADLGIQLRTYGLGGLSGAVLDCAAAGLPTVTNVSLGDAVGVPSAYFRKIPDALSPVLLAESLAGLLEAGLTTQRPEAERRAYSQSRSFEVYARMLCDALALDLPARARQLQTA
jgi:glycosyltransferase involved in cell wall biosynthesis